MAGCQRESSATKVVLRHFVVPSVNSSTGGAVAHSNVLTVRTARVSKHTVLVVKVVLGVGSKSRVPGDGVGAVLGTVLVVGRKAGTRERVGDRSRGRSRGRRRSGRRSDGDNWGLGGVGDLIIIIGGSGGRRGRGISRRAVRVLGSPRRSSGALGIEHVSKLVDVDGGDDGGGGSGGGGWGRVGASGDGDVDVFVGGDNHGACVLVDSDDILGDGDSRSDDCHKGNGAKTRKDLHIEQITRANLNEKNKTVLGGNIERSD